MTYSGRRISASFTHAAFSLVEVTLTLGILAVGLLSLISVVPTGMDMIRKGHLNTEQSQLLKHVSTAIHSAVKNEDTGTYQMHSQGDFSSLQWAEGGGKSVSTHYLMSSGMTVSNADDADYICRLEITPPADAWSCGQAAIHIASPASATWENDTWKNAQVSNKALVLFRSK